MSIKIRIKNETLWPTKMLRPFIARIAREEFPGTKPSNTRSRVTVEITYNRAGKYGGSYCTGYAYYDSSYARVRVPFPHPGNTFPVLDFCTVVGHEFGHCKGIKHADMGLHYDTYSRYAREHYAWAKALPVPVIIKKPKPTTADKRAARLKAAEAAVVRWTRKRKLSETKLKYWVRRVKALRKLASVTSIPKVDTLSPPVVTSEASELNCG